MKVYQVGGAVRDKLLGLPERERDWVVVGATPEEMIAKNYRPVGKDFPVFLHPETAEEYALARTERKTALGYQGFVFHADKSVTLEEDLLRRDLTVNAIAEDEHGELTDPFHGKKDLEDKILRHVSPAFSEDPVRLLRLARFYAQFYSLGFIVADETMLLIKDIVRSGEVNALVKERVWKELAKGLATESPDKFFRLLRDCGALEVLFPELNKLFGVPNMKSRVLVTDAGVQALICLKRAAESKYFLPVRFAALIVGLGKGLISTSDWGHAKDYTKDSVALIEIVCKRHGVPNEFRDLALVSAKLHYQFFMSDDISAEQNLEFLNILDVWRRPERLDLFLDVCKSLASTYIGKIDDKCLQLRKAYERANSVDIKAIVASGAQGEEIKSAIVAARLQAILHA